MRRKPLRSMRHGNLAKIHRAIGQTHVAMYPVLVSVMDVYVDENTGFYRVNVLDTRTGAPYFGVQCSTLMRPLPKSMGMLVFMNGDPSLPQFIPFGW